MWRRMTVEQFSHYVPVIIGYERSIMNPYSPSTAYFAFWLFCCRTVGTRLLNLARAERHKRR